MIPTPAGLVFSSDEQPGLQRLRRGKGFRYRTPRGQSVRDAGEVTRINALAIPPAWESVWICADPHGHLQATGRDAKGRKQFRYHPDFRADRDTTKYGRMLSFGQHLPKLRRRVKRDLKLPGIPLEKVLATVVLLLQETLIRVGNREYARSNNSFGLTTLRDRHVKVKGGTIRFQFNGKSGVKHAIDLHDCRLARVVKGCQDLPGQDLFQYTHDDGHQGRVSSADVNHYIREAAGGEFTAKDLRTWAGTTIALATLSALPPCDTKTGSRKCINDAIDVVAQRLGNTRAVCRSAYVHPAILEAFEAGSLADGKSLAPSRAAGLSADEARLMAFLRKLKLRPRKPA